MDNAYTVTPMPGVSSSTGIGNIVRRKTGAHLYVMQAGTGRIKIGRSSDPKGRRRTLETAIGQPLFLLNVFKGRGAEERAIHAKLAKWREAGEWFANTPYSRMAMGEAVGSRIGFRVFDEFTEAQAIAKAIAQQEHDAAMKRLVADILSKPTKRQRLKMERAG